MPGGPEGSAVCGRKIRDGPTRPYDTMAERRPRLLQRGRAEEDQRTLCGQARKHLMATDAEIARHATRNSKPRTGGTADATSAQNDPIAALLAA